MLCSRRSKRSESKNSFLSSGQTKIALLESTDPEGPIGKFVEKNGGGMHHMAFAVEDVAEALNEAAAAGCQLIDKAPRTGAEGLQIGFLHPKSTKRVLTELCGKK